MTTRPALTIVALLALASLLSTGVAHRAVAELPPFSRVDKLTIDDLAVDPAADEPLRIYMRAESKKGAPISDLRVVDLSVNQDGAPFARDDIRLEKLGATSERLRCVIVLDVSRVMRDAPLDAARDAAMRLADALQTRGDEVAIVVFGGDASVLSPFSDAPEEQRVRLEQLEVQANSLSTALYDGLTKGLELAAGESTARARFVVLFSDGEDNGSVRRLEDVLAQATVGETAPSVPVFSIGYSRVGSRFEALHEIARASRGAVTHATSTDEIAPAFTEALTRIQNGYVVHVRADLDGGAHEISLAIEDTRASRKLQYPEGTSRLPLWIGVGVGVAVALAALLFLLLRTRSSGQLVFVDGPRAGQGVAIRGERLRIGALPDNDIVLDHETVSRHHAEVRQRRGGIEIEDLGSTNGTLVNGQRIARPQLLQHGDRLHIGSLQLVYKQ